MPAAATEQFHAFIQDALQSGSLVKATLSRPEKSASAGLRNVFIRSVEIRGAAMVAWTFRYGRRDEVKNLTPEETGTRLREMCGSQFRNADVFTAEKEATLTHNRRGEPAFFQRKASAPKSQETLHDRNKARLLDPGALWLRELGLSSDRGAILPPAQAKWRQINKFVEIIAGLVRHTRLPEDAHIADMGCGKGYLTFALYDYLVSSTSLRPQITGVELRPELAASANRTARNAGFDGLEFAPGSIASWRPERLDMLIALHACDTATDDALATGVLAGAQVIVSAPCCHKEVRQNMAPNRMLEPIVRHGILAERQAELLTDALRALILEQHGYRTSVFEFISPEHTSKNLMIAAVRQGRPNPRAAEEISALKDAFGLPAQRLESLLAATLNLRGGFESNTGEV